MHDMKSGDTRCVYIVSQSQQAAEALTPQVVVHHKRPAVKAEPALYKPFWY